MKINALVTGSLLMGLAIILGAFGAHALKDILSPLALETYQTGISYHIYHSLALLIIGLLESSLNLSFPFAKGAFIVGVILFSFNCYLYALTGVKTFAMLVPIGGSLFILGWFKFAWDFWRSRNKP